MDGSFETFDVEVANRRTLLLTISLVIAVIIFTSLLFGVALLNSVIATRQTDGEVESQTVAAAASRIQSVAGALWQAEAAKNDAERQAASASMSDITGEVNDSLLALRNGGLLEGDDGRQTRVVPVEGDAAKAALSVTEDSWKAMQPAVAAAVAAKPIGAAKVTVAVQAGANAANGLLRLHRAIFTTSQALNGITSTTRSIFTAAVIVVFLFIVQTLLRTLRESQRRIEADAANLARQRDELQATTEQLADEKAVTDTIMQTVNQGLFLMTPDFKIAGGQYSSEVLRIFRVSTVEGFNLVSVMQRLLSERVFNATKKFLEFLFDEKKKQRTILQINPLHEIEISFTKPEGGYESRYLNFSFRRIMDEGKVSRVFVAVNDVTERVELAQQLKMTEAKKDRQFEFLLTVINVDPKMVREFIDTAKAHIKDIDTAMRTQDFGDGNTGQTQVMRQRLERVFRAVHSIKGNAQMIKLNYFVTMCQAFEAKIVALRNRSALSGDDFMAIVLAQVDLAKDLEELDEISQRFVITRPPGSLGDISAALPGGGGAPHPAAASGTPSGPPRMTAADLVPQLNALAASTAASNGKQVRLEVNDFDPSVLNPDQARGVRDIMIQLVRNSCVHGIEAPDVRQQRNKPPVGTITVVGNASRSDAATNFTFTYRDDGGGLNVEAIRRKAVENGLLTAEAAAALAPGAVVGLIFQSGFSTAAEVTEDAGRGVGMDIIKDLVVDRFGGRIGLKFEPGRYTEFSFTFPLAPRLAETNGAVLVGAR